LVLPSPHDDFGGWVILILIYLFLSLGLGLTLDSHQLSTFY